MARDPFAELGLTPEATESEIREARRRLAKRHHPDTGGDDVRMGAVNAAAAEALRVRAARTEKGASVEVDHVTSDVPSFTVEALPVETFEALAVVAGDIGEVVDDDPPYRLDVVLHQPLRCWCRLDVLPDAGASTVSLLVGALDDGLAPSTVIVRDLWVAALNDLDWPESP